MSKAARADNTNLPVGSRVEVLDRASSLWQRGTVVEYKQRFIFPYLVKPDEGSTMMIAKADEIRPIAHALPLEEEAAEPLELDKLSPELLCVIAEIVAANDDVIEPWHLGSLARSCKAINAVVEDAKDKLRSILRVEFDAPRALLGKCGYTVEQFVAQRPTMLKWFMKGLTAADSPALTKVLKSKAVAQVEKLQLQRDMLGDEGATAVAAAAAAGGLPRLRILSLPCSGIGDAGVQALADACADRAFRELKILSLGKNKIGNAGVAALVAALEKGALPELKKLLLHDNVISEDPQWYTLEGMKALKAYFRRKGLVLTEEGDVLTKAVLERRLHCSAEMYDEVGGPV